MQRDASFSTTEWGTENWKSVWDFCIHLALTFELWVPGARCLCALPHRKQSPQFSWTQFLQSRDSRTDDHLSTLVLFLLQRGTRSVSAQEAVWKPGMGVQATRVALLQDLPPASWGILANPISPPRVRECLSRSNGNVCRRALASTGYKAWLLDE